MHSIIGMKYKFTQEPTKLWPFILCCLFILAKKKEKKRKYGNFPLLQLAQLERARPSCAGSIFPSSQLRSSLSFWWRSLIIISDPNKSAQGCRHTHTDWGWAGTCPGVTGHGQISLSHANAKYYLQSKNILEKYLGDTVPCFKLLYLAIIPIFWVLPSSTLHLHLEGSGFEVLHFTFQCQHFQFQLGWKNPQCSQGRALHKSSDPIQGGTEH